MALTKDDLDAIQALITGGFERFEKTALPAAFDRYHTQRAEPAMAAALDRFASTVLPVAISEALENYHREKVEPRFDQVLEHIDGLAKRVKDRDDEFAALIFTQNP